MLLKAPASLEKLLMYYENLRVPSINGGLDLIEVSLNSWNLLLHELSKNSILEIWISPNHDAKHPLEVWKLVGCEPTRLISSSLENVHQAYKGLHGIKISANTLGNGVSFFSWNLQEFGVWFLDFLEIIHTDARAEIWQIENLLDHIVKFPTIGGSLCQVVNIGLLRVQLLVHGFW